MDNNILIVDDEPMLLNALVDKFTREGFTTMTAKDGREGLASALKNHPDLILLDIIMPVMDGMAVLEELRKDPWGKDAKVILLTNLSETEKKIAEPLLKAVVYLVKSDWKIDDVVKEVRKKLAE